MPDSEINVRCPSCRGVAAVDVLVLGSPVACPFCDLVFDALPEVSVRQQVEAPIVPVARKRTVDISSPDESQPDITDTAPSDSVPFLIGLALLPLALPIVWVILISTGAWEPLFTAGVPIAIGIGATGLGIGVALTRDWSVNRKMKSILAITLLACSSGGALFLLKKEWGEAVRKRFGADEFNWHVHDAWPFRVKVPPHFKKSNDPSPLLPNWQLQSVRYTLPKDAAADIYRIAHGAQPAAMGALDTDPWFEEAVKQMTSEDTGPPVRNEAIAERGFPGRQITFRKSDGATNLTVRLYRVGQAVILLAVEGPLLPADARDVQTFFRSLYIKQVNRR